MEKSLLLRETVDTIILEIPKALLSKGRSKFSQAEVLELVAAGRREYKEGKTLAFNSIKELLHGQN